MRNLGAGFLPRALVLTCSNSTLWTCNLFWAWFILDHIRANAISDGHSHDTPVVTVSLSCWTRTMMKELEMDASDLARSFIGVVPVFCVQVQLRVH